jgi:hypothetical protein
MTISSLAKAAVGVTTAAVLLAGCSGGGMQSGLPTAGGSTTTQSAGHAPQPMLQLFNTTVMAGTPKAVRQPLVKDFMRPVPDASLKVWISDSGQNTLERFAYAGGAPTGQVSANLSEPQGMCQQKKTFWLANTGASTMIHYNAAGHVLSTLSDTGQFPVGCSTHAGNLAVSNIINVSGGPGSVTIYANGTGTGRNFAVSNLGRVYFIGYDGSGDLFVSGETTSSTVGFAELKAGGSAFAPLTLSGATINFPGTVQFARSRLVLGDQSGSGGFSILYQTTVANGTATVTGSTNLTSALDAVQCFITGKKGAIAPDAASADGQQYNYPAGGSPTATYSGLVEPIGSVAVT